MNHSSDIKITRLHHLLKDMGRVVLAFSGGVDSTFLLNEAVMVLKEDVLAVVGRSPAMPCAEYRDAIDVCAQLGVTCITVMTCEMENEVFRENPPERCYICKLALFNEILKIAKSKDYFHVIDGSNADDLRDIRPGMRALQKLGIRSPLLEVGITKKEIRHYAHKRGLPTWDKPAAACLYTRIPFGEKITLDRIDRIEKSESFLQTVCKGQIRVRDHGDLARIELDKSATRTLLTDSQNWGKIVRKLKNLGYLYVTLDLEGYRMGSFNEMISKDGHEPENT